jgi:hypothetical protein
MRLAKTPKVKIGVVLPSRGLLFSQSFEELLRELKPFDYQIYFAHGKPIPDCFNIPLDKALRDKKNTHILFCEDDMALPKGVLRHMVDLDVPATALDYPFKKDGEATILHDPDGFALYSGTGFLLVWREVLDKMPKPVFRTDLAWDVRIQNHTLYMWPRDVSQIKTYGLHDINFGLTLWTNGMPILPAAPGGQRKLVALGQPNTNNGAHIIKELTKVGIDNITKTDDEEQKLKWMASLSQVQRVEILSKIPDDIEIVDGQARVKGGNDVVI